MELSVKDRLYLPMLLPPKGNYAAFNLKKSIRAKVAIADGEARTLGLESDPQTGNIRWDVQREKPLDVAFSAEEMRYLRQACERLADEELPDDMWGTVSKIYDALAEEQAP